MYGYGKDPLFTCISMRGRLLQGYSAHLEPHAAVQRPQSPARPFSLAYPESLLQQARLRPLRIMQPTLNAMPRSTANSLRVVVAPLSGSRQSTSPSTSGVIRDPRRSDRPSGKQGQGQDQFEKPGSCKGSF